MIIKKGDRAQRLMIEEKIKAGDISREEGLKKSAEFLRDNPGKAMLRLQRKAVMIGKKIEGINKVLFMMKKERDELRDKIENTKERLKNQRVKPGQKIEDERKKALLPYKQEMDALRIKNFMIIKISRVMLDDYWSTKEMLKKFRKKIKEGEIVIKDKEAFKIFDQHIEELKKAEKNAIFLESIWRESVKRLNQDRESVN